jgi:D-tyrosyl-tRNA(Tyr) deacylase
MIALIQRVASAEVRIDARSVARIGPGLLALIGIVRDDGAAQGTRLLQRLLDYRVFPDEAGRMNRSLRDLGGELLLVPQFTLAADTDSGNRPGFQTAAAPEQARTLYGQLLEEARRVHRGRVVSGEFGAHMQVSLVNDGPVTFWLEVPAGAASLSP